MFNRKIIVLFAILFSCIIVNAQLNLRNENNTSTEKFENKIDNEISSIKLKNGLTIYLNEDHTQKEILGAVIVRGGAKLDLANATGTAHYFEHMMFKGSTSLEQ